MHPLTHHYLFGGMAIASDTPLGGLRRTTAPGAHPVRLTYRHAPAPAAEREIFAWEGRYAMRLGVLGDAWHFSSRMDGVFVADAAVGAIDFYGSQAEPTQGAIDVLTRRVLPRLATATGALTIHGAALSREGGAVLMFGRSGAGKSTLTAALALAGWHVASDDLTMIRTQEGAAVVHPGATGVGLWEDTLAALAVDRARCFAMPGYDGKWRFEPEELPSADPAPIRALVFLDRNRDISAPRLDRMPIGDAVREATRQLIALDPTAPRVEAAQRLLRTMSDVPAVKLTYPNGYDGLPAVAKLLATLT